jgi:hypothetical protein
MATFGIQHTSLEARDSKDQKRHDIQALFRHARQAQNVVATGTEAGTEPTRSLLPDIAKDFGFFYTMGGDSWVAVDQRWATRRINDGFVKVVDSGSGHSTRGVAWMAVLTPAGRMSFASMHLLTDKSSKQEPYANDKLTDAAVEWARLHGPLAFVNADVNRNDQTRNVWESKGLVTCWDELDSWPDTHEGGTGATIDVISRLRSGPAEFTAARRFTDAALKMNADHCLIQAKVKVKEGEQ